MTAHRLTPERKQQVWQVLRAAHPVPLTLRELSALTNVPAPIVGMFLSDWMSLGAISVAQSKPKWKVQGRPPSLYSVTDPTVVHPPYVKYADV